MNDSVIRKHNRGERMFDLYIFDMGGVVSRNMNMAPAGASYLEFDGGKMIDFASDDFRELTIGKISVQEFVRRYSLKSGHAVEDELLNRFFNPDMDPDVVAIIDTLKNGARVVAGTNTIGPHYEIHLKNGDYRIFDAVYASHLMGLAKPDPVFYTYILKQEGCPADRAVFVDDFPENVEAARQLGIHSFLFTGAEKLKEDLTALKQRRG